MSRKSYTETPISRGRRFNSPKDLPSNKMLPECPNCHAMMWSNDEGKHRNRLCKIIQSSPSHQILKNSVSNEEEKISNGFIKDNVMYGEVTDISIREKELDKIPEHLRDCLLLMNQIGMEALDLTDGDFVRVKCLKSDDVWTLATWSFPNIKRPCHVGFLDSFENKPEEDDCVVVQKMPKCSPATSIYLSSTSSTDTSIFTDIDVIVDVKKKLTGRYIYDRMKVSADGVELILNVQESDKTNDKGSDISTKFSSLSMNGEESSNGWPIFYYVTTRTRFLLSCKSSNVTFNDIAGLDEQIQQMKDFLVTPIDRQHLIRSMRGSPIRGIVIHGFTGTGKTHTVNAFMNEFSRKLFCVHVDSAKLISKNSESTDKKISSIIDLCIEHSPSVLFIDRLDVIASSKKSQTDIEKKLISCLLSQFDRINSVNVSSNNNQNDIDKNPDTTSTFDLFIVGITNQLDSIDSVVRGPSRFDAEIEFPIPLAKHRRSIFHVLMSKVEHSVSEEILSNLAERAFSFTGADLKSVVARATILALKDNRSVINENDIRSAFKMVRPSAMREILLEVPAVKWSEIGGVSSIRTKLEQMVLWPFKHPEYFSSIGISPRKGILMYGPPGCSKTMIGKALATESNLNFISIKGPELFNKYVGESEKAVRDIFKRAKQASPSILFFDEIDALASERSSSSSSNNNVSDRVLAQLLTEMDGIEKLGEVTIVAATNRPDMIDPALLRPGRLDAVIYVPLPDEIARKEIFHIRLTKMPLDADVDIDELVKHTDGYSGAEVTAVCTEAGLLAMTDSLSRGTSVTDVRVARRHFDNALKIVRPRTSRETIEFFEQYQLTRQ